MPAKRKIVREGQDSPYSKRSRRTKPNQTEISENILDIIRSHQDEDGHCVASTFNKVPSKRQNPEYHEVVLEPIDLTRINQRLRMDEYRDVESLTADIDLLVNNTRKFYDENSDECKDATALWELYLDTKANSLSSTVPETSVAAQRQETVSEELYSKMDEIYNALLAEVDEEGQGLSDMFLILPNEDEYLDYYETIKEPIDLTIIGQRIRSRVYKSSQDLEKDLLLLIKNAKSYNEPSSKIYSNAVALKKALKEKMQESEKGHIIENSGVKTSARLKQRNSTKYDSDSSLKRQDAVDFSESMVRSSRSQPLLEASITSTLKGREGLQAKLYNDVVNYRTFVGHSISDAFVRLPNKHHYPAYYEEIENPISLKTIRRFILAKKYESITDLAMELHLLFKNAMQYNKENSQIYKNADTLQKFMESRLEAFKKQESEIIVSEEESEVESGEEREDEEEEEDEDDEGEEEEEVAEASGEEEATGEEKKKRRRRSDFGVSRKGKGQIQKEKSKSFQEHLRDRLRLLYNTVLEAKDGDRNIIELFMEKPSRKDYPDYFKLILEPIDMKMIEKKIRQDKFSTVAALIEDFNLMFNNAGHYNEPGSQVYQDATKLREILGEKQNELPPLLAADTTLSTSVKTDASNQKSINPLIKNMEAVYQKLRIHQDVTGREICEIFNKLPSKQELPDYYQVIKKPVDMDRILQKIQGNNYANMNEFMADIVLMFENACAYNEPGSVIYKDALIMQKLAVDTCGEVMGSGVVPDVQKFLQEMLTSLFVSVMNHQDEDGRCYSDSLTLSPAGRNETAKTESSTVAIENQVPPAVENKPENKLSLEAIRRNLHARRYRRLDVFQEQMFQVFENARSNDRTDSEVYEDAVELQRFFIKIRDELCKNGEILMSPALTFTFKRLQVELDAEKQEKLPGETQEDEKVKEEGKEMREAVQRSTSSEGMDYQGITYQAGDFVYVEDSEESSGGHPPHVVCIEKLYQGEEGEQRMYGVWFFRPQATYHLASRKFLLKEVFKSDYYNTVPVSRIRGKCFVMMAKDYFKLKPVGYSEDDVYVCVSRYSSRQKSFKRIKLLNLPANNTKIVPREKQLVPVRVSSVYSDDRKDEMVDKTIALGPLVTDDVPWPTNIIDVERENIVVENVAENTNQAQQKFYLQYIINRLCLKVGDCVYASQPGTDQRLKIARIESIWTDMNNMAWFQGSWFAQPVEIEHEPTRMFYKNEVFLFSFNSPGEEATTATREATPLSWAVGRCAVLSVREMAQCRPTEIPEQHIHVCESRYLSQEKMIKKIKGALKKPSVTHKKYQRQKKNWYFWSSKIKQVVDDEVYYFKKPLNIQKEISPQLAAAVRQELHDREEEMKREIEENRRKAMQMQPNPGMIVQQSYQHPIQPGDPRFIGQQYTHYQQPMQQQQYVVQHGVQQQYIVQTNPSQQVQQGIPMQTYTHHQYTPGTQYTVQPQLQLQVHQGISPGMVQHAQPHIQAVYQGVPVQHVYPGQTGIPQVVQSPLPNVVRQTETPVDRVATPNSSSSGTPTAPKKKGRGGHSTGYILFASQCHPKMRAENPDMPFGDISKLVGEEWRKQTDEKKREFEEKARELTAKAEAEGRPLQGKKKKKQQMRREMEEAQQQQQQQQQHQHPPPQPHVVMQQSTATGQVVMSQGHYGQPTHYHPQAFQQQQQPGLVATPQQSVVTPSHSLSYNPNQAQQIISTPAGPVAAQSIGQQFISPGQTYIAVNQPSAVVQTNILQGAAQPAGLRRGPLFVKPPSKVQRVLHSEAYLRYIESLEKGNRTISNWEKTVSVQEKDVQLTQDDAKKLPVHWLANGAGKHGTIKTALWSLRDLMLKDALAIKNHM